MGRYGLSSSTQFTALDCSFSITSAREPVLQPNTTNSKHSNQSTWPTPTPPTSLTAPLRRYVTAITFTCEVSSQRWTADAVG